MSNVTFGSPGVKASEIDLTGGSPVESPTGVPAAVVGPSRTGPAFVPVTVANFTQFVERFGDIATGKSDRTFGPMAMRQWLANRSAGTYLRVLGAGDGKRRVTTGNNTGRVNNAGFIVGGQLVQADGQLGNNPHALASATGEEDASTGRTYLFGCFMSSGSNGLTGANMRESSIFSDSGIIPHNGNTAWGTGAAHATGSKPILRGILMAASGVTLTLSGAKGPRQINIINTPTISSNDNVGGPVGLVRKVGNTNTIPSNPADPSLPADGFVMFINGHTGDTRYVTASFDMQGESYFADKMNQDISAIEEHGYVLYSHWDVHPQLAVVTGAFSRVDCVNASPGGYTYPEPTNYIGFGDKIAFMLTSSLSYNSGSALSTATILAPTNGEGDGMVVGSAGIPNFEGFEDRYKHAISPWVISQNFGANPLNLFRVHAIADGSGTWEDPQTDLLPNRIKMSVSNISAHTDPNVYSTFDLEVRHIDDLDYGSNAVIGPAVETFKACTLDPDDANFVGRMVGDMSRFYDWDKETTDQVLVVEGKYPNKSKYIRLELNPMLEEGAPTVDVKTVPCGFRGHAHLVTSGSDIVQSVTAVASKLTVASDTIGQPAIAAWQSAGSIDDAFRDLVELPMPMRECLGSMIPIRGSGPASRAASKVPAATATSWPYWGIQFEQKQNVMRPTDNKTAKFNKSFKSWVRYYPDYQTTFQNAAVGNNAGTPSRGGTVLDCDKFNNNSFTLENIQVITSSVGDPARDAGPDTNQAVAWLYRRDGRLREMVYSNTKDPKDKDGATGQLPRTQAGRFLTPDDFTTLNINSYLNFSFFLQGGFDGLNIFDKEKGKMSTTAVRREFDNTNQGGIEGPTVVAYRKAVDILEESANVDIQLLAIPGIRHPSITNYAMDAMEDRFDALYLMDIELKDSSDQFVTGSDMENDQSITNTVRRFNDRNLDSSFAAAYYPDVIIQDSDGETMTAPATVCALGAIGFNDSVGQPWFAPAGVNRAKIQNAKESKVKFFPTNMDKIYAADINPITSLPTYGLAVMGNKTLYKAQSALDRINVRRLLIDIRRKVRNVANTILFEPNRATTLAKFASAVDPILSYAQSHQGVDRYRVVIDSSTTTQADVENNTIRGKIFLQPTKSVEFIALDFVVTGPGQGA